MIGVIGLTVDDTNRLSGIVFGDLRWYASSDLAIIDICLTKDVVGECASPMWLTYVIILAWFLHKVPLKVFL